MDLLARGVLESSFNHPLLNQDFLRPVLKHFANGDTRLLLAYSGGELQFVTFVEVSRLGTWRTLAPSQLPITPLLWAGTNVRIGGISDAPLIVDGRPLLSLDLLHFDDRYLPRVEADERLLEVNWYSETTSITCDCSFSTYWSARSKKLRDNIGRYQRRVDKDGLKMELRQCTEPDEIGEALSRYSALETAGWKGRAGTAIEVASRQGMFYSDVLSNFARRKEAVIFELVFNNEIVASRIGVRCGGLVVFLKTTYDENYSRYAPGRLLLFGVIKHFFDTKAATCLEFYTKATPDQAQWATDLRPIRHVCIFRHEWLRAHYRAAKRIKGVFASSRGTARTSSRSNSEGYEAVDQGS